MPKNTYANEPKNVLSRSGAPDAVENSAIPNDAQASARNTLSMMTGFFPSLPVFVSTKKAIHARKSAKAMLINA